MHPLTTSTDFEALLDAPVALVYKHSTRCPIAGIALEEVELLSSLRPELPIHVVDVIRDRPLSRQVAERVGITHHSPQAILLVQGHPKVENVPRGNWKKIWEGGRPADKDERYRLYRRVGKGGKG